MHIVTPLLVILDSNPHMWLYLGKTEWLARNKIFVVLAYLRMSLSKCEANPMLWVTCASLVPSFMLEQVFTRISWNWYQSVFLNTVTYLSCSVFKTTYCFYRVRLGTDRKPVQTMCSMSQSTRCCWQCVNTIGPVIVHIKTTSQNNTTTKSSVEIPFLTIPFFRFSSWVIIDSRLTKIIPFEIKM